MEIHEKKLEQECATRWNFSFYTGMPLLYVSSFICFPSCPQPQLGEPWYEAMLSYEESTSLCCVLPILHGFLDGLQKETNPPASDYPIMQLDLPDFTCSQVPAPAVDPMFKQLKLLDQATIETVKSELVSCMEAFFCFQLTRYQGL